MPEGILHSLKDFRFVSEEARNGLEIDACWWGGTPCPGNATICSGNVGEDFADRANTPSVGRQVYFSAGMASARRV